MTSADNAKGGDAEPLVMSYDETDSRPEREGRLRNVPVIFLGPGNMAVMSSGMPMLDVGQVRGMRVKTTEGEGGCRFQGLRG